MEANLLVDPSIFSENKDSVMHLCNNCSREATKICSGCHDAPDAAPVRYCSAECQKQQWATHKKACKASQDRKALYRAGETAQELFYVWREVVYDKNLLKIDRTDNQIILYESFYNNIDDCFIPFPESLVKDEREKKALLTYLACNDAYGFMDVALKKMLTGIYKELQDVPVMLQSNQLLKMRLYDPNGKEDQNFYQHETLKITLKDGSTYIMDIAAAQYGIDQPVLSMKMYQANRGQVLPGRPFGYQRSYMEEACNKGPPWRSAIMHANKKMYSGFNNCIESFESSCLPLTSLVRLKEDNYRKSQKHLVKYVHQNLNEYKRMAYKEGYFKFFAKRSMVDDPIVQIQPKERTFEEDVAELLGNASAKGHKILDMRGRTF